MIFSNFVDMRITYKSICFAVFFFSTRLVLSQQIILVYCVGETYSDSPYVTASTLGEVSQSLGINEFISFEFDEVNSRNVEFSRQGCETKTILLDDDVSIVQIRLKNAIWGIQSMREQDVPSVLIEELHKIQSLNDRKRQRRTSTSPGHYSILVADGIPPEGKELIIFKSNFSDSNCVACTHLMRATLVSRFGVLDRADLQAVLDEQKLGMSGLTGDDEQIAAGEILGAEYGARPTCISTEGTIIFTLEFINLETTAIEGVVSLSASNLLGVSNALEEVFSKTKR